MISLDWREMAYCTNITDGNGRVTSSTVNIIPNPTLYVQSLYADGA